MSERLGKVVINLRVCRATECGLWLVATSTTGSMSIATTTTIGLRVE